MKIFYYSLYIFVMACMMVVACYCGYHVWSSRMLPTCFYDFSTWVAVDELIVQDTMVQALNERIENGYYYPDGNTVYAAMSGIVEANNESLILISDRGVVITYAFHGHVKVGERVRAHDLLGTSSKPIAITFSIANQEISYEQALQY